ncbi:MAG: hypothetical protein JRJ27_21435 [Deltaproteobacteria bacterium]|nr:hypothetical protein [Deltaproteobacteria bacterium]
MKTKIKAAWIIAYDGQEHRYLKNGEIVFEGQEIIWEHYRFVNGFRIH